MVRPQWVHPRPHLYQRTVLIQGSMAIASLWIEFPEKSGPAWTRSSP